MINTPYIKTTCVEVTKQLGTKFRVFLKNELEQPSLSFKLRGIGHLIGESLNRAKVLGKSRVEVFSSSGGNAGLAAAYASNFYKIPCTVVLPSSSKPIVIKQLESLNAKVFIHGAHWGEADSHLRSMVEDLQGTDTYPIYCHPFDNPKIWEGHSTLIDELVQDQLSKEEVSKLKGVVCSVGGGGLYNGVVHGLNSNGLSKIPVIAIETIPAPTFTAAIQHGGSIKLDKVPTLATSLASPYLSTKSYENYLNHKTHVFAIEDYDALKGSVDFYDNFGKLIEPACGATIATVGSRLDILESLNLESNDIIVLVVCGGSAISTDLIEEYRSMLMK